jgi:hypothetical protein
MNSSKSPETGNEPSKDDQLDWYFPGKSKAPHQFLDDANTAQKPSHFHTMIQKLNIATTLAALVLFFLPWIDIQCSQKSFATQTGIQTIYGGGSPSDEMKAFAEENGQMKSGDGKKDVSMGYSPLVALALLAVIGAVVVSFKALRSSGGPQTNLVGILCATALVMISAQMMIGFPVKKNLGKSMAEASKKENTGDPMGDLGTGMATAMMMNIQVRHLPALYIELIMLGLPTLVLANGLIDKIKKA